MWRHIVGLVRQGGLSRKAVVTGTATCVGGHPMLNGRSRSPANAHSTSELLRLRNPCQRLL